MEVEEEGEVEEGSYGTLKELKAIEFLNQEAYPSRTMFIDARNGFNELSRLAMLWTVQHHWTAKASFAFNFYWHWAQPLLLQPGEPPVTILSQ